MARGKQTCKILKEIRRQIAEANGIELVTSECRYKGDCLGSCPKCEAEVRFLEQQLRARTLAGRAVSLAGISVSALAMLLPSCTNANQHQDADNTINETDTISALTIADTCAVDSNSLTNDTINDQTEPKDSKVKVINVIYDIVGECAVEYPNPSLQLFFENENGEFLDAKDIKIVRLKTQNNVVVDSALASVFYLHYYDIKIDWKDLPIFEGEKIDEVDNINLRVSHPDYDDDKILEIKRPDQTFQTILKFKSPEEK